MSEITRNVVMKEVNASNSGSLSNLVERLEDKPLIANRAMAEWLIDEESGLMPQDIVLETMKRDREQGYLDEREDALFDVMSVNSVKALKAHEAKTLLNYLVRKEDNLLTSLEADGHLYEMNNRQDPDYVEMGLVMLNEKGGRSVDARWGDFKEWIGGSKRYSASPVNCGLNVPATLPLPSVLYSIWQL